MCNKKQSESLPTNTFISNCNELRGSHIYIYMFSKAASRRYNRFSKLIEHLNTSFSPIPEHVILVTWDIEAMYPSIDNKIGLQACRKILDSREVLKPSTDCLLDAIKITLDNNNSTFNNTHYLQTDGTAMGPKNACSYADVSVNKIDELVFQHEYLKPICWGRYRDDCFGLWNGSLEELRVFTSYLSSIYSNIRFTVRFDCYKIEFLDVMVVKQNGRLETTVYSKETDGHMYLLPSSSHFHSVSDNIPYGVALRLKRICSTEEEFSKKSIEYKNHLCARGYKRNKVKKQFQKDNFFSREILLTKQPKISSNKKIVLNLDYHPTLRNVGSIIKRHLPILYKSVAMKETFNPDKTRIMICFGRHKNLKEILSPAAFPTNKNKQAVLYTGCKKCNKKCYVCRDFLQESATITSLATGIKYKIKEYHVKMIGLFIVPLALSAKHRMWVRQSLNFTHFGATTRAILTPIRKLALLLNILSNKNVDCKTLKLPLLKKSKLKIWTTLKIGKATGNASYLPCNHMALMSEKNLKGVPTNLSLSITRFVCCSYRTQLSAYPFIFTFLFFLFPLSYMLVLCLSLFFIGHGWLDIHGVCLHFYCRSLKAGRLVGVTG